MNTPGVLPLNPTVALRPSTIFLPLLLLAYYLVIWPNSQGLRVSGLSTFLVSEVETKNVEHQLQVSSADIPHI